MEIVAKIKNLCRDGGVSLSKLERENGLTANSIYRWDASFPSIDKVIKVAQYFNVSLDYLCGLTDKKTPADELDGLTDEDMELIRLFAAAPASRQEAVLALLKAP